jgi:hypothetical protein
LATALITSLIFILVYFSLLLLLLLQYLLHSRERYQMRSPCQLCYAVALANTESGMTCPNG